MLDEAHQKLAQGQAICLNIKVTPKSGKHEISGILDNGTVKIRLKSAPENNKANEELIEVLSEFFSVKRHKITILTGEKSKTKVVEINP